MNLRKSVLFCWVCNIAFYLVVEIHQPATAFNVIPPTGSNYRQSIQYTLNNNLGSVTTLLDPPQPQMLAPSSVFSLGSTILNTYGSLQGWNFNVGSPLNGTFHVIKYLACGPFNLAIPSQQQIGTECAGSTSPRAGDAVGADYGMYYTQGVNDPQIFIPNSSGQFVANPNIRWLQLIQEVTINKQGRKSVSQIIDNGNSNFANVPTPFYPNQPDAFRVKNNPNGTLTAGFFFADTPQRIGLSNIIELDRYWKASLFLAEQTGPKTATIYSGVSWGWRSIYNPSQQLPPPPLSPRIPHQQASNPNRVCPPGMPTGSCIAFGYLDNSSVNALVDSSLLSFDEPSAPTVTSTNSQPDTGNTATVPESSSMLGVLAVGAWAGVSWRKRRNQQSESELAVSSST